MLCAEQTCPSEIATLAMRRATDQTPMIFGQMNEPPGARLRVALSALSMAECFRAVQRWSGPLFTVILDVMAVGDTLAPPGS